jgi:hypothetical protein
MQPFWWFVAAVVPCPTGDQITNGHFATGDFSGWAYAGDIYVETEGYIAPHYAACNICYDSGFVEQDLSNVTPTRCFDAASTFHVMCYGFNSGCVGEEGSKVQVEITYTDTTVTTVIWECSVEENETWAELDLKPYLSAGKIIKHIKVTINLNHKYVAIDDIKCMPSPL